MTRIVVMSITLLMSTIPASADWLPKQITQGNGSGGVVYQTAYTHKVSVPTGYDSMKPFGLAQMDNGQVAMLVSLGTSSGEVPAMVFSSDAGATWSAPERLPGSDRPTMLTYLGGGNISFSQGAGITTFFSHDYGRTWPLTAAIPLASNGLTFGMEGNAAVDRDVNGNAVRVMEIGWNWNYGDGTTFNPALPTKAFFRYSLDGGFTWQGEVSPPTWQFSDTYQGQTYERGVSEGSVVRAKNGWLVASLRTDMPARFVNMAYDSLEGTAISISKDNGQTWSPLDRLFDSGRQHGNLQLLPNGDILLTMIRRADINVGSSTLNSTNRGEDALISHDNGLTWDPMNSLITISTSPYYNPYLWADGQVGHVATTVLNDGAVVTAYGKYTDNTVVLTKWNPNPTPTLVLLVDSSTGSVSLSNQSLAHSRSLDGYTIQSASGSLHPAGHNGFTSQNVAGWTSVAPSSAAISELNLSSSATLGIGQSYDVGNAFVPNGNQDLAFQFSSPNAIAPTTVPVIYTNVVQLRVVALLDDGGASILSTVAMIANGASSNLAIDGYSIVSATGSLSAAGFNGFTGHGVAGWESVGLSANGLSELNLRNERKITSVFHG